MCVCVLLVCVGVPYALLLFVQASMRAAAVLYTVLGNMQMCPSIWGRNKFVASTKKYSDFDK